MCLYINIYIYNFLLFSYYIWVLGVEVVDSYNEVNVLKNFKLV